MEKVLLHKQKHLFVVRLAFGEVAHKYRFWLSTGVAPTRKTGGSADGYKPLLLKASVSRRWLSLCSSHCAFHSSRIPKGIAPTQIRT